MKVLLLNQCFWPDVVSTAQHLTDLAIELAGEGHEVTVVTGDRGYDDPSQKFPRRETWRGIRIIRIPALSLGKKSRWRRALGFASFLISCSIRLLLLAQFDAVIALTSPPLISFLGALFVKLKGGKFFFWVMDLNPDEAVAAGWLKEGSLVARMLGGFLRYSLRHAARVIVLDRFMKDRIRDKGIAEDRIAVLAPWAHSDAVRYDEAGREEFRRQHNLAGKFVVMYSGNHSPCHPLDTLLRAAGELAHRSEISFCFVGGGSEQEKVRSYSAQHQLANVLCLGYQPMKTLAGSLSAADLHVVVMGEAFAGIVHPCKVYNVLEVRAPLLYIGPAESHVEDLISQFEPNAKVWSARHGEVDLVVRAIGEAEKAGRERSAGTDVLSSRFSKTMLLPEMLKILDPARRGNAFDDRALSKEKALSVSGGGSA